MFEISRFILVAKFCFIFVALCVCEDDLMVTTKSGKMLGKISQDRKGNDFYSFQSIPYGKPPIDDLRFKDPEPNEPWVEVLNATIPSPSCSQDVSSSKEEFRVVGQEDCLYLNVYTPTIGTENGANDAILLPVMVYIHGGSFRTGSSAFYGPEYLMTENIVLATINYRLGLLGFLSFTNADLDVPGNAGLKDQVLAMKWIKENIQYFGGNLENITIFGESAGSASVHLHVLSPMSKGLFNKAIAQSGSATSTWVIGNTDTGKLLGETLNIDAKSEVELLDNLQKVPLEKIIEAQVYMLDAFGNMKKNCCVVVEEMQSDNPKFLPDTPINILRSGNYNQVPMILGYNNQEGMLLQMMWKERTGDFQIIEDFKNELPSDLCNDTNTIKEVSEKVNAFYLSNRTQNENLILQPTIDYQTDINFFYQIYHAAVEHAKVSKEPIYFYRFSADTKLNLMKRLIKELIPYPGAAHGDDIGYLFKIRSQNIEPGSIEDIAVDRIVRLWTNFAKHGNPTPTKEKQLNEEIWKTFSLDDMYLLEIGNEISASSNPEFERYKFWEDIYKTY